MGYPDFLLFSHVFSTFVTFVHPHLETTFTSIRVILQSITITWAQRMVTAEGWETFCSSLNGCRDMADQAAPLVVSCCVYCKWCCSPICPQLSMRSCNFPVFFNRQREHSVGICWSVLVGAATLPAYHPRTQHLEITTECIGRSSPFLGTGAQDGCRCQISPGMRDATWSFRIPKPISGWSFQWMSIRTKWK